MIPALSQISVICVLYTCRPNLVGFVNPAGAGLVVTKFEEARRARARGVRREWRSQLRRSERPAFAVLAMEQMAGRL